MPSNQHVKHHPDSFHTHLSYVGTRLCQDEAQDKEKKNCLGAIKIKIDFYNSDTGVRMS